jgi:hypothetical protein
MRCRIHAIRSEIEIFRKVVLSALALAALGMTAFVPSAAEASPKIWVGPKWHGHVYYGGPVYYGYGHYASCWTKRWVKTKHGPRLVRVNICY